MYNKSRSQNWPKPGENIDFQKESPRSSIIHHNIVDYGLPIEIYKYQSTLLEPLTKLFESIQDCDKIIQEYSNYLKCYEESVLMAKDSKVTLKISLDDSKIEDLRKTLLFLHALKIKFLSLIEDHIDLNIFNSENFIRSEAWVETLLNNIIEEDK